MSIIWFLIMVWLVDTGVELSDGATILLGLFYIGDAVWSRKKV